MKKLNVPLISAGKIKDRILEQGPFHSIGCVNWQTFTVCPRVEVRAAHDGANLWIYFRVHESCFRAVVTTINGPVYTDSCVELFISPDADGFYYNLEFNAIGTVLGGYGRGRDRAPLDPSILSSITTTPSLRKEPVPSIRKEISWDLLVKVPSSVFMYNRIPYLSGLCAKGNMYKCGDLTPDPHYLSLWPIKTEKPDFHRYEFFGDIVFGE
jgi:hypothetical protein